MADVRPPLVVELIWSGDLRFDVSTATTSAIVDADSKAGLSPMQHTAVGLAGCMSSDVADIIRKGRHPLKALRVTFRGTRADSPPRRFLRMSLEFQIDGAVPAEVVERAIRLSHEKYCSVWHSFRQDIELTTTFQINP